MSEIIPSLSQIKDEIVDAADSFNATTSGDLSKEEERDARAARLMPTRSGQSSPSREVQVLVTNALF